MKSLFCLIAFILTGCATSQTQTQIGSPKGRPEVIVQHADMQSVQDECAHWVLENGFSVDWTNTYSLGGTRFNDSTAAFYGLFADGTHIEVDFNYVPEGDNIHLWAELHPYAAYYGDPHTRDWMQKELETLAKQVVTKR